MPAAKTMPLAGKLKLVVVDLDGTILGGHRPYVRIPEEVARFLDGLEAAGCRWAISTTWDPEGQWNLVAGSPVKSRPAYFMGEYGNQIATWGDDGPVPLEDYNAAMREKLSAWRQRQFYPVFRKLVSRFNATKMLFYGHVLEFYFENGQVDKIKQFAQNELSAPELKVGVGQNNLSIRPAYLHKGLGLKEVVAREGLRPDQVAVAGDGVIDLPMMQAELARYYVAPANAHEDVKNWVLSHGGAVSDKNFGAGVVDAFMHLK